jgi:hypothetical protein
MIVRLYRQVGKGKNRPPVRKSTSDPDVVRRIWRVPISSGSRWRMELDRGYRSAPTSMRQSGVPFEVPSGAELPNVRGDLLQKLGRFEEARAEFETAASITRDARERQLLRQRAGTCGVGPPKNGGL